MHHVAFVILLLPLLAAGDAPVQVAPRPVSPKWVEIKADADGRAWIDAGDKALEWELIDRTGAYLDVPPGSKYAVFAASDPKKPATYRVVAVADGKLIRVMVNVAGGSPLPPDPKPGPPDPPDAFTAKLQTAYTADLGAMKAADLKQLIGLYLESVDFAKKSDFATAADLFAAVSAAATALLPPDANGTRKLAGLRALIGADLAGILPADPESPLTEALRAAAAAAFARYAKALQGVTP